MLSTLLELAGFAVFTAGMYLLLGAGAACLVGGALLVVVGVAVAAPRGDVSKRRRA